MTPVPAGINKKSFSLFYNGGEIWCEHLDALGQSTELLNQKFAEDLKLISRPSTSSYLAICMDQTKVSEEILEMIIASLSRLVKPIKKVAFIGLNPAMKRYVMKRTKSLNILFVCMDDYEKAKAWLIP